MSFLIMLMPQLTEAELRVLLYIVRRDDAADHLAEADVIRVALEAECPA